MVTFNNNDNDDDLDWEQPEKPEVKPPHKPSTSVSSPFGSNEPMRPVPPVQKPVTNPFSTIPKKPVTPPQVPVKRTLPPKLPAVPQKPATTPFIPTRPTPVEEVEDFDANSASHEVIPEITPPIAPSSEEEDYLNTLMKSGSARTPQRTSRYNQEPELQTKRAEPKPVITEASPIIVEDKAKNKKIAKASKWGAKPKNKVDKTKKPKREDKYQGDRRNIMFIRLAFFGVAIIVGLAGMKAIFLPNNGPSQAQVKTAAQEAVGYTGFPTVSGEQFAIDFSRAYFNFSTEDTTRKDTLLRFASEQLVRQIDIDTITSDEYEKTAGVDAPKFGDLIISQTIVYGPYVVATNNISETDAVFTVKVGLDSGAVIYMDVPVKYSPKNYSMTLAGPPSFVKPIQNAGSVPETEYVVDFGTGDKELQKEFQPDLEAYLAAWAKSDKTIINRYLYEGATDNASRGLQNTVQFYSLDTFIVEPADDANPATENRRRAEITVTWQDPETGLRYPQQYRILLGLNQENNWSIYDIENFAILN
jgi:hypothetical protein